MTSKEKILEIFKSDWQEAIADAAYFMVENSQKSSYIDQYETVRNMRRYGELLIKLVKSCPPKERSLPGSKSPA